MFLMVLGELFGATPFQFDKAAPERDTVVQNRHGKNVWIAVNISCTTEPEFCTTGIDYGGRLLSYRKVFVDCREQPLYYGERLLY